jgi:hypothetical protein
MDNMAQGIFGSGDFNIHPNMRRCNHRTDAIHPSIHPSIDRRDAMHCVCTIDRWHRANMMDALHRALHRANTMITSHGLSISLRIFDK